MKDKKSTLLFFPSSLRHRKKKSRHTKSDSEKKRNAIKIKSISRLKYHISFVPDYLPLNAMELA